MNKHTGTYIDGVDVPRGLMFLCVLLIHLISPAFPSWGFGMRVRRWAKRRARGMHCAIW